MKTKSKILTCLGAMALATVAILPSSVMAAQGYNETYNYTKHWGSFKDMNNQYSKAAGEWCKKMMEKHGATCCSKDGNDLGRPGLLSGYSDGSRDADGSLIITGTKCDLWDRVTPDGKVLY